MPDMSEPTPETVRSRGICGNLLRICFNTYSTNPGLAILGEHLYHAFTTGTVVYPRATIEAEIVYLVDRGLLEVAEGVTPRAYRVTPSGVEFCRANYPWEKVDQYSS